MARITITLEERTKDGITLSYSALDDDGERADGRAELSPAAPSATFDFPTVRFADTLATPVRKMGAAEAPDDSLRVVLVDCLEDYLQALTVAQLKTLQDQLDVPEEDNMLKDGRVSAIKGRSMQLGRGGLVGLIRRVRGLNAD